MRLSFSSGDLTSFGACQRFFQLTKLLDTGEDAPERENNEHFMFGHAVGAGIAELLLTNGDVPRAIGTVLASWDYNYEKAPKYLQVAFSCIVQLADEFPFDDYEPLVLPNGKPAVEVGTRIWLDKDGRKDYYVLFADAIMLHKATQRPTIIEVKTTKRAGEVAPLYTNSAQSVLYSLPLPYLFPQYQQHAWDTVYIVCQLVNVYRPVVHILNISHTYTERLSVLMGVMLQYEHIQKCEAIGYFPKVLDGNCTSYGRICDFYGICDRLALTCPALSLEQQNRMDPVREEQIVLDLHMQSLLNDEMQRPVDNNTILTNEV
jgi:hypothetical protein